MCIRESRRRVSEAGRLSDLYGEGVSCPAGFAERSEAQRAGYRERQRQEALAAQRGDVHVGAPLNSRRGRLC